MENSIYYCSEGCGFVDKNHRCEQWTSLYSMPKKAFEGLGEQEIKNLFHVEEVKFPEIDRIVELVSPNEDVKVHSYCGYFRGMTARKHQYIISEELDGNSANYRHLSVNDYTWRYVDTHYEFEMRLKELKAGLEDLQGEDGDHEHNHGVAEDLLLNYINDPKVSSLYASIEKWYG